MEQKTFQEGHLLPSRQGFFASIPEPFWDSMMVLIGSRGALYRAPLLWRVPGTSLLSPLGTPLGSLGGAL